ncbi:hypothetical protein EON81_27945 [bacterium]|nr:MAG: hypothetical protein EON81_27945 [bacterium]
MKRSRNLFLSMAATSALVVAQGCGGGGGGGTGITNSTYAGSFAGNFDAGEAGNGTVSVTVATDGTVNGSLHSVTSGTNGTLQGTVQNNGHFTGTSKYPGQSASTLSGTLVRTGSGITGNLTQVFEGDSFGVSFTLTESD